MLRSRLSWLPIVGGSGDEDGDDAATEEDDSSPFRPSRLDASVLFGHGRQVEGPDETTTDLEEAANELETEQRNRR